MRSFLWGSSVAMLAVACHSRPVPPGPSDMPPAAVAPELRSAAIDSTPPPGACGTLRDVATSDVVRLDGDTLYVADETHGLSIVDVRDPDHPTTRANVPFVGTPLRLFVREGLAWLVYVDWDRGSDGPVTVVRVLDVRDGVHPRALGEVRRDVVVHDAQLVAGVLYLLHDTGVGGRLESFVVRAGRLERLDSAGLRGHPVQLAPSPAGLLATSVEKGHVIATRFDLPLDGVGQLVGRVVAELPGGLPLRSPSRVAEMDEGGEAHLVSCSDPSCSADASVRLTTIRDRGARDALDVIELFPSGGFPVTRFAEGKLAVASVAPTRDHSALRMVDFGGTRPRPSRTVTLRGAAASIAEGHGGVLVLGVVGPAGEGKRLVLHDVAVDANGPSVRGAAAFGSDWTSSTALDAPEAVAFDATSHLVAIPFAAFDATAVRWGAGAQVLELSSRAPLVSTVAPTAASIDRAVFVRGRLLTVGSGEIHATDLAGLRTNDDVARRVETRP